MDVVEEPVLRIDVVQPAAAAQIPTRRGTSRQSTRRRRRGCPSSRKRGSAAWSRAGADRRSPASNALRASRAPRFFLFGAGRGAGGAHAHHVEVDAGAGRARASKPIHEEIAAPQSPPWARKRRYPRGLGHEFREHPGDGAGGRTGRGGLARPAVAGKARRHHVRTSPQAVRRSVRDAPAVRESP